MTEVGDVIEGILHRREVKDEHFVFSLGEVSLGR
jgi:hypothetical protein